MHHRLANGRMASIDSPYVHVSLHESWHRQALGLLQHKQARMQTPQHLKLSVPNPAYPHIYSYHNYHETTCRRTK